MTTYYHSKAENGVQTAFFPLKLRCFSKKIAFRQQMHVQGKRGKTEHMEKPWGEKEARKTTFQSSPVIRWGSDLTFPYLSLLICERLVAAPTLRGFCDLASKGLCTALSLHVEVAQWNCAPFSFLLGDPIFQTMYTGCFQSWTCLKVDLELF